MKNNAEMLRNVYTKTDDALGIFTFFIEGDWHYLSNKIIQLQ